MKLKTKDLNNMSKDELQSLYGENKEKLFDVRLKIQKSQLKNVKEMKQVKKNIARILTVIKSK